MPHILVATFVGGFMDGEERAVEGNWDHRSEKYFPPPSYEFKQLMSDPRAFTKWADEKQEQLDIETIRYRRDGEMTPGRWRYVIVP